jgi:hypothetical protein
MGEKVRRALVETPVNCGIKSPQDNTICYLEFGTSKMDPKPFFQPAINEARLEGIRGFIRHNSDLSSLSKVDTLDQLLGVLALALERRVKEIIAQKGLIDTGTLRASVLAVPGGDPSKLPDESEFSGFDSENQAPATAGRALTETVEVDI